MTKMADTCISFFSGGFWATFTPSRDPFVTITKLEFLFSLFSGLQGKSVGVCHLGDLLLNHCAEILTGEKLTNVGKAEHCGSLGGAEQSIVSPSGGQSIVSLPGEQSRALWSLR